MDFDDGAIGEMRGICLRAMGVVKSWPFMRGEELYGFGPGDFV